MMPTEYDIFEDYDNDDGGYYRVMQSFPEKVEELQKKDANI